MEQSPMVIAITNVANQVIKSKYPLMGENHFSSYDVTIIMQAYIAITSKMQEEKSCQKS